MSELLIGCGSRRERDVRAFGREHWSELTTLDLNRDHNPDVVHDLRRLPLPFPDNAFDEIHAYDVLEHTGQQGDYSFFFAQWCEFWRILRHGGAFCATVPAVTSRWAWGDPGHTRVIQPESLVYLDQAMYRSSVGTTKMSDYRYLYKADFLKEWSTEAEDGVFSFVLRAIKPARTT